MSDLWKKQDLCELRSKDVLVSMETEMAQSEKTKNSPSIFSLIQPLGFGEIQDGPCS